MQRHSAEDLVGNVFRKLKGFEKPMGLGLLIIFSNNDIIWVTRQ